MKRLKKEDGVACKEYFSYKLRFF